MGAELPEKLLLLGSVTHPKTTLGFPRGMRPHQSSSSTPEELSPGESDNKHKWCPGTLKVTNTGTQSTEMFRCLSAVPNVAALLLPVRAVALPCNQTWKQPQSLGAASALTVSPPCTEHERLKQRAGNISKLL